MKTKRIKAINLPTRLPFLTTTVTWIALDHWSAPQWGYAVAITLGVIVWGISIYAMVDAEYVDIFKDKR